MGTCRNNHIIAEIISEIIIRKNNGPCELPFDNSHGPIKVNQIEI